MIFQENGSENNAVFRPSAANEIGIAHGNGFLTGGSGNDPLNDLEYAYP